MTTVTDWRDAPAAELAVLGDPISHSWSPKMQAAALTNLGLQQRYVAIRVPLLELHPALDHLSAMGYTGVNLTSPLKQAVHEWAELDPIAQRCGSANTIRLLDKTGTTTDGIGVVHAIRHFGISPQSRVLLLGAGGAARAAVTALSEVGGFDVSVWNRSPENAIRMLREVGSTAEILPEPDASGFDVVLNATSASHHGSQIDIKWSDSVQLAMDMAYGDQPTPFVRHAREHNIRSVDGRYMLVYQGIVALKYWFGAVEPNPEVMLRAVNA